MQWGGVLFPQDFFNLFWTNHDTSAQIDLFILRLSDKIRGVNRNPQYNTGRNIKAVKRLRSYSFTVVWRASIALKSYERD